MTIRELRAKRASLASKAREIHTRGEAERRALTTAELSEFDRLMTEAEGLGKRIEAEERLEEYDAFDRRSASEREREADRRRLPTGDDRRPARPPERGTFVFEDQQGRSVRSLQPHESFAAAVGDLYQLPDGIKPEELNLGRMVRAIGTGTGRGLRPSSAPCPSGRAPMVASRCPNPSRP